MGLTSLLLTLDGNNFVYLRLSSYIWFINNTKTQSIMKKVEITYDSFIGQLVKGNISLSLNDNEEHYEGGMSIDRAIEITDEIILKEFFYSKIGSVKINPNELEVLKGHFIRENMSNLRSKFGSVFCLEEVSFKTVFAEATIQRLVSQKEFNQRKQVSNK